MAYYWPSRIQRRAMWLAERDTPVSQELEVRAGVASARQASLPCACTCTSCLWDLWKEGQGCSNQEAPGFRSSGGHQEVAISGSVIMSIVSLKSLIELILNIFLMSIISLKVLMHIIAIISLISIILLKTILFWIAPTFTSLLDLICYSSQTILKFFTSRFILAALSIVYFFNYCSGVKGPYKICLILSKTRLGRYSFKAL